MTTQVLKHTQTFTLESGETLPEIEIGYHTYGTLNEQRNNVVWVCHALTANSDVLDWWKGLFGAGYYFDPAEYFIVCANVLGSAYGTTSPLHQNPTTGLPYYLTFPDYTIRDVVKAHQLLAAHLGVTEIHTLIGGSLGGQQALEWSILEPERINNLILIATNARHSPWGIAFNESQRLALQADDSFYSETPDGGSKGLKAARSMALLSYRTYHTYGKTQKDQSDEVNNYRATSYQNYQGDKLVNRFNAYSYWYLSKVMDSHNVGRGRGGVKLALATVKAKTLVIGITSDVLFPIDEQHYLADNIPGAQFTELDSFYGHDGFLIDTEELTNIISTFLKTNQTSELSNLQHSA
ncbi:homoserine O-acetyltransferase family protein [Mucilaginibacter myungsuensis]|uniref:Homoserine O-acetyltransferase n=1 Tax=Mucilaginibacter myungsuensis TaxID=649104 RepID=A0A929KT61_9SPHI|nr:homoserine O-acetyltransferase [Mucilaginibacter myungsuensis]MBE9660347.1 homoserine O-acetyltransferase [Mucilaginibacter myungsuensis]MDN3600389.1 homoserine O-acetyltransferase [Mucilaginibacter myungsuensis]